MKIHCHICALGSRLRRLRVRPARLAAVIAFCTLAANCMVSRAATLPWSSGSTTIQFMAPELPSYQPFSPPFSPAPMVAADFNGDGHLDLAAVSYNFAWAAVRLTGASGVPGQSHITSLSYGEWGPFTAADVDEDGLPDLVTYDGTPRYRHGNGDGTFGPPQDLPNVAWRFSNEAVSVAVADMDGDGHPDVIIDVGNGFQVMLNSGGGTFAEGQWWPFVVSPHYALHMAVADVNGDGRPDVIVAEGDDDTTRAYLNRGDGTFGPGGAVAGTVDGACFDLVVADVNGDGRPDLIVGKQIYVGDGTGDFSLGATLPLPIMAAGDLDGDGHVDAVLADSESVVIARGDGTGKFAISGRLGTGPHPYQALILDLDGDGRQDLVVNYQGGNGTQIFMNGPGGFQSAPRYPVGHNPVAIATLDANQDGIADLIVGNRGSRTVSLLMGAGAGVFAPGASALVPAGLVDLALADLYGDGRREIVVACDSSNTVSVIPLTPSGGFGARTDLSTAPGQIGLAIGDVNHDGRDEAVIAGNDFSLTLVKADGSGNLSSAAIALGGAAQWPASCLALGDLSGDGNLDIEVGGQEPSFSFDDYGSLWLGDGSGGFAYTSRLLAPSPGALAFSNLNGSGHADLVAISVRESSWVHPLQGVVVSYDRFYYKSSPDDEATSYQSLMGRPGRMAVADVDGDGYPDIAFTDAEGNALDIIRGMATGLDQSPISLGVGAGPRGLVVADLDGDGIPDVAIADSLDDDVMVLLSSGAGLPTAVTSSLVTADVDGTTARLRWSIAGGGMVSVERAVAGGAWSQIARLAPDGSGYVSYTDAGLERGSRYGYRLRLGTAATSPTSTETWLTVPLAAVLALRGATENPAHGVLNVAFSLPSPAPAKLQLFDISGRQIESRDVGALGAGDHVLLMNGGRRARPGVYLVRLSSQGRHLDVKLVAID